jgi:ribosomal protein S18 acetylase RimI-like enzyme
MLRNAGANGSILKLRSLQNTAKAKPSTGNGKSKLQDMIEIREALPNELNIIRDIAYKTWPVAYGPILSNMQLDYMLEQMYSIEALNKNLDEGHHFLIAKEHNVPLGFASYILHYPTKGTVRIPKIYVLPETQGKGIGRLLIDEIQIQALKHGAEKISLNVNRFNNAKHFYEKLGFEVTAEEDIEIGNGYLMEDYIMEKQLP